MITTKEYSYSISEVLDILRHTNEEDIEKIPLEVIKQLNDNKSEEYVSTIDFTKPLEKSNISKKALGMLAYIYREYLCTEEERKEYDKIIYENDIRHENELKEKFIGNDLFQKRNVNTNLPIEIVKESFFKKIINKIKKFIFNK